MKKDLMEYKRKYNSFRHHAWAGLGFLSVVMAFRLLFHESADILNIVIFLLIIYIIVSLLFTYRYRAGLSAEEKTVTKIIEQSKDDIDLEKERLKIEKKKAKVEAKTKKKSKK